MSKDNILKGKRGEDEAARFLRDNGYKILARNIRTKFGEIDIIATESDTICFIEVKSRGSLDWGEPCEAVVAGKQKRISRSAVSYLKERGLLEKKSRFDVVSVVASEDFPRFELIQNAFDLDDSISI